MATKNIREIAQGNQNIWKIDPRIIQVKPGWNGRDEGPDLDAHIETIALSILHRGYDPAKPMVLFYEGDDLFVSEGHCRRRAVLLAIEMGADVKTVPVVMEERGSNDADRLIAMLISNAGRPLSPIEQGRIYKRLAAYGYTDEQIANTTGRGMSHVKGIFDLMGSTPHTQAQVVAGSVSATAVAQAVRTHGAAKAERVVSKAVKAAKQAGKTRATARAVVAAGSGEEATKARPLSEIVEFFRATIVEQDGPPGVQRLAEVFLAFRDGKITPAKFMAQLAELVGERELVPA